MGGQAVLIFAQYPGEVPEPAMPAEAGRRPGKSRTNPIQPFAGEPALNSSRISRVLSRVACFGSRNSGPETR